MNEGNSLFGMIASLRILSIGFSLLHGGHFQAQNYIYRKMGTVLFIWNEKLAYFIQRKQLILALPLARRPVTRLTFRGPANQIATPDKAKRAAATISARV